MGAWWDDGATFDPADLGICVLDYFPTEGAFVWPRYTEHDPRASLTTAQPSAIFVSQSMMQQYAYGGPIAEAALLFMNEMFFCIYFKCHCNQFTVCFIFKFFNIYFFT